MDAAAKRRWNSDPLWGFLLALAALGVNAGFFVGSPGQAALPWLSLLLAVVALVFVARGLRRAIVQSQVYRGMALSVVLSLLTLLVAGFSIFVFETSRKLPDSASAPQVGQRVPDFTISDTQGRMVSLDSLLAAPDSQAAAPKAVLLIFYRGHW